MACAGARQLLGGMRQLLGGMRGRMGAAGAPGRQACMDACCMWRAAHPGAVVQVLEHPQHHRIVEAGEQAVAHCQAVAVADLRSDIEGAEKVWGLRVGRRWSGCSPCLMPPAGHAAIASLHPWSSAAAFWRMRPAAVGRMQRRSGAHLCADGRQGFINGRPHARPQRRPGSGEGRLVEHLLGGDVNCQAAAREGGQDQGHDQEATHAASGRVWVRLSLLRW